METLIPIPFAFHSIPRPHQMQMGITSKQNGVEHALSIHRKEKKREKNQIGNRKTDKKEHQKDIHDGYAVNTEIPHP